ncbi:MAG: translesion DNA synthesis-associated protein ImuA [Betaproteobacteria bacterium]|nr:MAG: translesion DNA synthesis-associated protein ImuA [Betaproteobacteria bacterium]
MSAALDTLLHNAAVWRGSEHSRAESESIPSGFDAFDNVLGGWPLGALIELIPRREGIGELSLLLPALARLSKDERWIALINPPYIPYAPALFHAGIDLAKIVVIRAPGTADVLWSMEQALRSGTCSAVLGWPAAMTEQAIRRLQLATETGRVLGAYFTQPGAVPRPSPVPYRLQIAGSIDDIRIEVLKRRGGSLTSPLNMGPVSRSRPASRP